MVSIWVEGKDRDLIIGAVEGYDDSKCEPLFEGSDIDELYVDGVTGDIEGYISVGPIGVSVDIPFELWFAEFVKFGSFSVLEEFLGAHLDEVEKIVASVRNISTLARGSKGSVEI